ncbi:MAG: response regulator [Candidatus Melainabacteria bacterium HGW-Melainabacteria-1]|nr:MAG: response regulator [Candidatus Melainabacteria bacterium HGW-Melainabacteria-1]
MPAIETSGIIWPDTASYRILLIDDDPVNNLICESLIKKFGAACQVFSFLSAYEALEWLQLQSQDNWPDLIFLDLNMPRMDGWDFLEHLRELPPAEAVSVKILSSSVCEDDLERASSHELVDDYLVKPLTIEHLSCLLPVMAA